MLLILQQEVSALIREDWYFAVSTGSVVQEMLRFRRDLDGRCDAREVRCFLFLSHLRPMGLSVLGCQSHLVQRCHPACGDEESFHLSPVMIFYRGASSALLQLVHQRLDFTCSRSHASRCGSQNINHENRTHNFRTLNSRCTSLPTININRPLGRGGTDRAKRRQILQCLLKIKYVEKRHGGEVRSILYLYMYKTRMTYARTANRSPRLYGRGMAR